MAASCAVHVRVYLSLALCKQLPFVSCYNKAGLHVLSLHLP